MNARIVVFDVLGTVLDERGSFRAAIDELAPRLAPGFADRWLDGISDAVARIARNDEPWKPWDAVVADHLGDLLASEQEPDVRASLSTVGHRLTPWPDSVAALSRIQESHHAVALSNAGLTALLDSSRACGLRWSAVLSSEMVRTTKPNGRVYAFLLETLRVDPADVLFVAAHPWDLRAAAAHGMRTAYVERPTEGRPEAGDRFDWSGRDLTSLAEFVRG